MKSGLHLGVGDLATKRSGDWSGKRASPFSIHISPHDLDFQLLSTEILANGRSRWLIWSKSSIGDVNVYPSSSVSTIQTRPLSNSREETAGKGPHFFDP